MGTAQLHVAFAGVEVVEVGRRYAGRQRLLAGAGRRAQGRQGETAIRLALGV